MIWLLYNLLFPIVYLLLLPRFFVRMLKRGGYRRGFLQRLGRYDPVLENRLAARQRVWIHAVSVGETFVALRFMAELRALQPELFFVLSTTTSTGHAVAAQSLDPNDALIYFPVDFPCIIRRVLNRLQPQALVLVENELWPNLVRYAKKRNIPIMLLNGRISPHSFRGYRQLRPFVRRILAKLDLLCVQGAEDQQRLIELGASAERVTVMGSAKYDVTEIPAFESTAIVALLRKIGFDPSSRVLVGGSTWNGEETALLEIFKNLRRVDQQARLVLAPRHAERANAVAAEIEKHGFTCVRHSGLNNGSPQPTSPPDVLLVDTTGELKKFYAAATVIFVGKSLTAHGGQNVIEPAAQAKPIVIGPYMENFTSVVQDFLAANAMVQVSDQAELEKTIVRLWGDSCARRDFGQRAQQVVRHKAGALRNSAKLFLDLIRTRQD